MRSSFIRPKALSAIRCVPSFKRTTRRDVQPSNTCSSRESTEPGRLMLSRLEHPWNACELSSSVTASPASKLSRCRLVQPVNALIPIFRTPWGMVICDRLVQPANALGAISRSDSGKSISLRAVQPLNAARSMRSSL